MGCECAGADPGALAEDYFELRCEFRLRDERSAAVEGVRQIRFVDDRAAAVERRHLLSRVSAAGVENRDLSRRVDRERPGCRGGGGKRRVPHREYQSWTGGRIQRSEARP